MKAVHGAAPRALAAAGDIAGAADRRAPQARVSDLRANLDKYLLRNTRAKIGLGIVLFFVLVAIFAPLLTPYQPRDIRFVPWQKPSLAHPFGVNSYGQDIFAQVVYGARVTVTVSLLAGLLSSIIGVFVGLYAGYKGGRTGEMMMRIVDVFLVLPGLALMIVLAAFLPRMGILNLVLIIGCLSWLWMARSIRAQTLSEARREYVDAARVLGKSSLEIMFLEILPNILPVVTANTVMVVTSAMLTEASLSFLGLGDPVLISWGKMLSIAFDNSAILYGALWWMLPPGLCIATLGFSYMLIGNSVLDVFSRERGGGVEL